MRFIAREKNKIDQNSRKRNLLAFPQLMLGLLTVLALISSPVMGTAKNTPEPKSKIIKNLKDLPELTRTMQEDLLAAARDADLEELRDIFETNELAPVLGEDHINDPISFWKQNSIDQSARDIMASLVEILSLAPIPLENGNYLWPYLAKVPLDKLTPAQQIDLFRLVGPKAAIEMLKTKTYSHYTLEIGQDGTWHSFKRTKK